MKHLAAPQWGGGEGGGGSLCGGKFLTMKFLRHMRMNTDKACTVLLPLNPGASLTVKFLSSVRASSPKLRL
jgi:hypothetical protein